MAQNLSGLAASTFPITRLGEAWRNRQGLLTLLVTFVGVAVLIGLGVASGVGALVGLLALAAYALLLLGTATAGQQFMDQAMGREITPTLTAMAASPMIVLRLIGLVIVLGLAVLAWFIVAAVLLFVCKLPVVGGVLLALVVPLLTFSGALVFAGVYVALSLAAPALFEGHGIKRALSQLWAVALQRPVEALLNLFILFFVVGFAMMLVGGFIFSGFFSTMGLTAAIVGSPMGPMMGGMGDMGGMGGYGMGPGMGGFTVFGMLVGGGIVWAVVAALAGALGLLGVCLTYLKLTDGLDMAHAEAALESAVAKTREKARQAADEARRRTQEMQEAARQRAEQARERQAQAAAAAAASAAAAAEAAPRPEPRPDPNEPPAFEETIIMPSAQQPPPPPPPPAPAPMATPAAPPVIDPTVPDWRCPACHATVTPDDIFCGACGHKLK